MPVLFGAMRSIEIFVKISRFLICCYFVHSVSLASTGAAKPICPDNILSPLKWTLHDDLCVLSGPDPLPWENASSFCRSISSDLLIFDDKILADNFNVSDPISRKTFLEHFNGTAGNDTWIGLHSVNKKLWWEYDVPVKVMREPLSSVYGWSAGQPDRSHALCGVIQTIYLPNGTPDYTLKLSMSSCESNKSFVCFRKSIDLTVPPTMLSNATSLCPKDWFGNVDSAFCYQSNATKSFDDAMSSCRMMNGTLMYPKSELEYYFVKAVFPRDVSQDNYWVGLNISNTTFDGESWKNWTYLQSRKISNFMDGCVYLRKANDSFQLWAVNCTNDGKTVAQFCQIASNPAAKPRPIVTADNYTVISRQNFSDTSLSLTCNVDEDFYHPTKPVVWVKDGIYFDNGPPPSGLTLMLRNVSLRQQLDVYNYGFDSIFQGTYHCEVWGVARDRLKLNQTLLTFEDVGTFRGTMSTSANWSMSLPPIAAETFWLANQTSEPNNILADLFESYNIQIQFDGIQCTVLDRTCSDVKIDFTLYYLYDIVVEWLEKLPNYISSSTLPPDFEGVAWQWFFNEKIYQYLNNLIQNVNAGEKQVTIRRTDGCAMETTQNIDSAVLHFQSATFNQKMGSAEVCMIGDVDYPPPNPLGDHDPPPPHPTPSESVANGTCRGNFLDGGSWQLINLTLSCMQPREPYIEELWDYTKRLLGPKTVLNVTRDVKGLTKGNLHAFDITSVAMILNNIAMVPNLPQDVAGNFLQIVENVLGVDKDSVLREAHTMPGNAPFRITNALEMLASNIQLNNSTNFTFQSVNPSFAFRVESTNSSNSSIGFGTRMSEYKSIYDYHEVDEFDTSITWSDEVTGIRNFLKTIFHDGVRTTYIIYENTGLFNNLSNVQSSSPNNTVHDSSGMDFHSGPPPNKNMDSDPKDFKKSNDKIRINSKVVSGLINGFPLQGLNNTSIRIIFKLNQKLGINEQCAFVNHTDHSGDSPEWGWSFLGLISKTPDKEMMSLQCYSSHLTNFASILNIDLPQSPILDIISRVGLVISIIGLAITLLSQIFIRKLRQTVSQLTIFNLALALLVVDIIVLAGIEPNPSYPSACPAVACLLHYFLLVAFSWMLIEAIVRYVKFTRHFRPDPYRFVRKVALPAWLLPAVVVAISAGFDNRHLTEPKKRCWLSPDVFHFGFLLPLGIIMLINLILFVLIIKLICCCRTEVRSNQSSKKILWRQTQASINTFIVVGLTWLFAFFAIDGTEGSRTAMAYLFCIFNCFQGFFIFALICLANKDFRKMVLEWFSSKSKKKPTNEKRKPPENLINRFRKGTLDKGATSLQQVQQITNGEYGTNSLSNDESYRTVSTSDGYSYGTGNNGYPDFVVCPDTIELNEITTSSGITGRIGDVDDKSDVCTVASNDTNSTTDSVDDYERRIARMNAVREETEMERAPSIFVENTNDIEIFEIFYSAPQASTIKINTAE